MAPEAAQHQRPRMFSIGSHKSTKSHSSGTSRHKMDLHETTEEKKRATLKTKADPRMALNEAQPADVAAGVSSMGSLRAMQHKDMHGNLIVDPDRSNPTRNRLERPLDTIRAFEAAVDGSYSRKASARSEPTDNLNGHSSRRSSYHQAYNNGPARPPPDGAYYGGRPGPGSSRPESYSDGYYNGPVPGPRARGFNQRVTPPPGPGGYPPPGHGGYLPPGPGSYHPGQPVYPSNGHQQSYDTVTSASGSGSHATDQWGNSTDPSSDNSSIERGLQPQNGDPGESYGQPGHGGGVQHPKAGNADVDPSGPQAPRHGYGHSAQSPLSPSNGRYYEQGENAAPPPPPPHVPPKEDTPPRVPIKLGGAGGGLPTGPKSGFAPPAAGLPSGPRSGFVPPAASRPGMADKRKSWFKRFSRTN
ncbi:MAG: hypothetical protein M1832_001773 [Thelocarpon impressellum]|nr:MAG: hypothetical protein M1832_001773 [Thelocarpon impressellum]